MPIPLFDAHNHLADPALLTEREALLASLQAIGLEATVVNGTQPSDWEQVLQLAAHSKRIIPAIGLHPCYLETAPADWQKQLLDALHSGARAIGEVGLDRRVNGHNLQRQVEAFSWQVTLAQASNLPLSIHCIKAIGPLLTCLSTLTLPARGFHWHGYNAAAELIPQLVQRGAYFSFNAGQLKPNARKVRQAIRAVPAERLLIETDAPNMLPPAELREFELAAGDTILNHPANLRQAYLAIAAIRAVSFDMLAAQVAQNFQRFFGSE
jgi:TatD DNase family protein